VTATRLDGLPSKSDGKPAPTPPDDVKKDPARLAKWESDQAKKRDLSAASQAGYEAFTVTGCDHTATLVCHHPGGSSGSSGSTRTVSCSESK
jgi:hypothetical protein